MAGTEGKGIRMHFVVYLATAAVALVSAPAGAYVGPGAGISALGAVVSFLAAVLLLIVGFVWYPVKRLLRRRRKAVSLSDDDRSNDSK